MLSDIKDIANNIVIEEYMDGLDLHGIVGFKDIQKWTGTLEAHPEPDWEGGGKYNCGMHLNYQDFGTPFYVPLDISFDGYAFSWVDEKENIVNDIIDVYFKLYSIEKENKPIEITDEIENKFIEVLDSIKYGAIQCNWEFNRYSIYGDKILEFYTQYGDDRNIVAMIENVGDGTFSLLYLYGYGRLNKNGTTNDIAMYDYWDEGLSIGIVDRIELSNGQALYIDDYIVEQILKEYRNIELRNTLGYGWSRSSQKRNTIKEDVDLLVNRYTLEQLKQEHFRLKSFALLSSSQDDKMKYNNDLLKVHYAIKTKEKESD